MTQTFTLLACQIDVPSMTTTAQRDDHMRRIAAAIDEDISRNGKVDLVVLPELASLDYSRRCFAALDHLSEPLHSSSTLRILGDVARANKIPILAGMARRDESGKIFISQVLVDANGQADRHYDKLHIAQFGDSMEKEFFTCGDNMMVFSLGGFTFGTIICYDIRSPELSRALVRRHGVDVILHPTAFCRDETFHTWQAFATTRAVENQVYFASVNRAGPDFGDSMLISPWMDETVPLPQLGSEETMARWTLSRDVLDSARNAYPFLKDARDDYDQMTG